MTADRWQQMVAALAGEPMPPPPPRARGQPHRVHRAQPIPDTDPFAEAFDAARIIQPTKDTHDHDHD